MSTSASIAALGNVHIDPTCLEARITSLLGSSLREVHWRIADDEDGPKAVELVTRLSSCEGEWWFAATAETAAVGICSHLEELGAHGHMKVYELSIDGRACYRLVL